MFSDKQSRAHDHFIALCSGLVGNSDTFKASVTLKCVFQTEIFYNWSAISVALMPDYGQLFAGRKQGFSA